MRVTVFGWTVCCWCEFIRTGSWSFQEKWVPKLELGNQMITAGGGKKTAGHLKQTEIFVVLLKPSIGMVVWWYIMGGKGRQRVWAILVQTQQRGNWLGRSVK